MEFDNERPDLAAFRELEALIRALGEEMAGWRRRALQAESQLKAAAAREAAALREAATARDAATAARATGQTPADPRMAELMRENAELRTRLDAVGERTRRLLDRMRFLRQQHELETRR